MIIDAQKRTTWYVGPMGNVETAFVAQHEAPVLDVRVLESLIFGAVYSHASDNVADVTFYAPELEPDVTGSDSWALIGVTLEDIDFRRGQWYGRGEIEMLIKTRLSAGNIYAGRAIADELSSAFSGGIAVNDGDYTGYLLLGESSTWARGGVDGILQQEWQIPFMVMPNR